MNELFPPALFQAGASASGADSVMFFDGSGYKVIWLMAGKTGSKWVRDGDTTLADAGGTIIGPADGVMVHPRSGPVSVTLVGEVRAWKFAVPLRAGPQLVGAGYPLDLSPADKAMDAADGFTAGASASVADSIRLWSGDSTPGSTAYSSCFYQQGGVGVGFWSAGTPPQDVTHSKLFAAFRAAYLTSIASNPGWVQPLPWQP